MQTVQVPFVEAVPVAKPEPALQLVTVHGVQAIVPPVEYLPVVQAVQTPLLVVEGAVRPKPAEQLETVTAVQEAAFVVDE